MCGLLVVCDWQGRRGGRGEGLDSALQGRVVVRDPHMPFSWYLVSMCDMGMSEVSPPHGERLPGIYGG